MRRLLILAVVAALVGGGLVSFSARAVADPVCSQTDPATGQCLIWVQAPGSQGNPGSPGDEGPKDTGSGAACFWDGPARGIANPPSGPVPCSNEKE